MTQQQIIRFTVQLSYEQFLQVYEGKAKNIMVKADDGRRIAFPARNIQSFLTRSGVNGYFEMKLTAENKFISMTKIR